MLAATRLLTRSSQGKVDATEVATQFVRSYYTVLAKSPGELHHFFNAQAGSQLAHGVEGGDPVAPVGCEGIPQAVAGRFAPGVIPQVVSIAAQRSAGGGILCLTSGTFTWPGQAPVPFSQTFFLARQATGFFVLNDILRLQRDPTAAATAADGTASAEAAAPAADAAAAEAEPPAAAKEAAPAAGKPAKAKAGGKPKEAAENEPPASPEAEAVPPENLTYAQRVKLASEKAAGKKAAAAPGGGGGGPKANGAAAEPGAKPGKDGGHGARAPKDRASGPLANGHGPGKAHGGGNGPPGRHGHGGVSVFVRNLPNTISAGELERIFQQFGAIHNGAKGITVKVQKSSSYAFVDFADAEGARAALGAQLEVGGRSLMVEERKPVGAKGARRGGAGAAANGGGRANGHGYGGRSNGHGLPSA